MTEQFGRLTLVRRAIGARPTRAMAVVLVMRAVAMTVVAMTVVAMTAVAMTASVLAAQSVPVSAAALNGVRPIVRPRAALDGAALDSALIRLEWTKWAFGNVGRMDDTQPLFADGYLNVGLDATGVRRMSKTEAFAMLRSIKVPPMPMELGDWTVVRAGRDARLVSFALRAMGSRMWVASLWERQSDGWATVFYQITPDAPMPGVPTSSR